jgi:hypothetical protein
MPLAEFWQCAGEPSAVTALCAKRDLAAVIKLVTGATSLPPKLAGGESHLMVLYVCLVLLVCMLLLEGLGTRSGWTDVLPRFSLR